MYCIVSTIVVEINIYLSIYLAAVIAGGILFLVAWIFYLFVWNFLSKIITVVMKH